LARLLPALLAGLHSPLHAADAAPPANVLPAEIRQALARSAVPPAALSVWVQAVDAEQPRLAWGAQQALNPASLFKLVTTLAALELLGPQYTWATPVWLAGPVRQGVLDGALVIKGSGDPRLTPERLWLLMRRVRQAGVREIRGDIVLDRSAFARAEQAPGDFDGEPLKPYNVPADALLLAQRSLVYTFTPDAARGVALVTAEPELAGLQVQAEVPLTSIPCDDWRGALAATPADPERMRFAGRYPASCGERNWPLAYADPASFDSRLLRALWQGLGGTLRGTVRDGVAPTTPPSFTLQSPSLAEVVRDTNKFSNNAMAQQLFLTLGLAQRGSGTPDAARAVVRQWLAQALGPTVADAVVVDNGSGLSRQTRISAEALGRLLLRGWRGAQMPEWLASLPVAGVDGTARRSRGAPGRAHLKTGSLNGVAGIAGVLHGAGGRRWAVVAVVQQPNAEAARPVLDSVLQWVGQFDGGWPAGAPAIAPPAAAPATGADNVVGGAITTPPATDPPR
jgi:D-alanyl-D-alanine carboxypeptidase/D-alanyl-D-alanine-endopeptidase (penicillin-binding protein 4)